MIIVPQGYMAATFPICLAILMAQPKWRMTDKPGNGKILMWQGGALYQVLKDQHNKSYLMQYDASDEDLCAEWLLYKPGLKKEGGDDHDQTVAK